jgi:predicted unusual protein kinase regulating ubiquinone biosynthesis (AarF/ABC1/UbiB family)
VAETPPSKSKRFLRLAGMTASVAGTYAKSRVKELFSNAQDAAATRERAHASAGETIASTLGQLKGAVMKVGQMAAVGADILPREVLDALRKLQRDAPPVDYATIAKQVEIELGEPPERAFSEFQIKPHASASIGQVHRARLHDGREVAVKIQYPEVDSAVDGDLAQLRLALRASGLIKVEKRSMDEIFDEIRARLVEELDYRFEAEQYAAFAPIVHQHAGLILPEVIAERSTQRVLTTTYEPSDPIDRLGELGYTQSQRDRIGTRLFSWVFAQVFRHAFLHADPHPGNLGARRDGSLVLYDFGCVKRLDPQWLSVYRRLFLAGFAQDYQAAEEALLGIGVRHPDRAPPPLEYYKLWRDLFIEPFLRDKIVDFATIRLHERVMEMAPLALKNLEPFQPARELIFLDRMLVGHYGNLRMIGAKIPALELVAAEIPEILPYIS